MSNNTIVAYVVYSLNSDGDSVDVTHGVFTDANEARSEAQFWANKRGQASLYTVEWDKTQRKITAWRNAGAPLGFYPTR